MLDYGLFGIGYRSRVITGDEVPWGAVRGVVGIEGGVVSGC
jgi:hypothetical protein